MNLWVLFGRFHPALVHFPIVVLLLAAALFGWGKWKKRDEFVAVGRLLVHVGAAVAVLSTVAGLSLADSEGFRGEALSLIELHRNLAFGATAAAVIASALLWSNKQRLFVVSLGLVAVASILASVTGHFGGMSVYGEDYYARAGVSDVGEEPTLSPAERFTSTKRPPIAAPPTDVTIDFVQHVQPIFEKSCYRCHDEKKRKGGLRLDKKKWAFAGGDGGVCIVPGEPMASKLFQLISLPVDHEDYMPPKGDPLSKDEVETIHRWIAEGAHWPEA